MGEISALFAHYVSKKWAFSAKKCTKVHFSALLGHFLAAQRKFWHFTGGAKYSYTSQLYRDGTCGPPNFARTLPIYAPFDSTEREQRVEHLKSKNG